MYPFLENKNADFDENDIEETLAALENPTDAFLDEDFNEIFEKSDEDLQKDKGRKINKKNQEIEILDMIREREPMQPIFTERVVTLADILKKYKFADETNKETTFTLNKKLFDFSDEKQKYDYKKKTKRAFVVDPNVDSIVGRLSKCRYEFKHDEIKVIAKPAKKSKDIVCEDWDGFSGKQKNKPKTFRSIRK